MDGIRGAVVAAGHAITPLLADERVTARWSAPSALPELSVGGLSGHLVRALETIELYLDQPEPPDGDLIAPTTYFVGALNTADLASPGNRGIRERGEAAGSVGPHALLSEHRARLDRLTARLPSEPSGRRVTVMRGSARMTLDAYIPTRLVEIVVHADDLVHSVGAEPVVFSDDVVDCVIDLLVATARTRHGDLAVVRALTRRERDGVEALRVF